MRPSDRMVRQVARSRYLLRDRSATPAGCTGSYSLKKQTPAASRCSFRYRVHAADQGKSDSTCSIGTSSVETCSSNLTTRQLCCVASSSVPLRSFKGVCEGEG